MIWVELIGVVVVVCLVRLHLRSPHLVLAMTRCRRPT